MSTELLSPEVKSDLQDIEEEDKPTKDLEQEIECPRCYDVMTLSSNFDSIGYVCPECDFWLVMK
jgi:DNA-directed RNA polymerase subunit RPC12/RpoP